MEDGLAIENSTGQNRIFIRDKESSPRQNSNPLSQQASGRKTHDLECKYYLAVSAVKVNCH
jgi:hypothetical protein